MENGLYLCVVLTCPEEEVTCCGSVFPLKLPNNGDLNESPS